jgi:hypothetical protein
MYPSEIVIPMKEELTDNGFNEMKTPQEVDDQLKPARHNISNDQLRLRLLGRISSTGCIEWLLRIHPKGPII